MASQFRHRAVVLAVGAAAPVVILGVLAAGPADAEVAPVESGKQIVFSGGGLLGLSCVARPDAGAVTVPADTTIRIVNKTGHRARLLLDGAAQGEIANSSSAQVLFRRGPVTLALKPKCVLSEESRTVRVSVEAAPAAPVAPEPTAEAPDVEPSPVGAGSLPDGGNAVPPPVSGGGTSGGLPGVVPGRRPGGAGLPDTGAARPGAVTGSSTQAQAGQAGQRAGRPVGGVAALPGMPPGMDPMLVPGAPTLDLMPAADAPVDTVAAEPVADLDPITEPGTTGLLAIVATVCVAGVTTGAIRAITSQRAFRARMV